MQKSGADLAVPAEPMVRLEWIKENEWTKRGEPDVAADAGSALS